MLFKMRVNLANLFFCLIAFFPKYNLVEGVCRKRFLVDPDLVITPSVSLYYNDGTEVTYACGSRQILRGPTTATCTDSSFHPPELPKCIGICKKPGFLNFDLIISPSKSSYQEGERISYSCGEGHHLDGATTATCTHIGFFDPPAVPQCKEILRCHTEKQTVCEPSGTKCSAIVSSSENQLRTAQYCDETAQLCFIYRFGVQGDTVTVNISKSGRVSNSELDMNYGCYDRSYLGRVDPSGEKDLSQLEKKLRTRADGVDVCVCNRDICNESVETAERNDATLATLGTYMIWGSLMVQVIVWNPGFKNFFSFFP